MFKRADDMKAFAEQNLEALNKEKLKSLIKILEEKISNNASKGMFSINYHVDSDLCYKSVSDDVKKHFEQLGYKVESNQHYDIVFLVIFWD